MNKFFIPTNNPEDWKLLLSEPEIHWQPGHSAKALAYCWQEANDFPECVRKVFKESKINLFQNIELLLAFPEYKVDLPGGGHPSQNDIFILAKGNNQLVSIMVEGKVDESFGETVEKWMEDQSEGKKKRLNYLINVLQLRNDDKLRSIRYQLLHRTASAIIEVKKFKAENALVLVHSFSKSNEGFNDYCQFLSLFGIDGNINSLAFAKNIDGINLYLGWVKGDEKYLLK